MTELENHLLHIYSLLDLRCLASLLRSIAQCTHTLSLPLPSLLILSFKIICPLFLKTLKHFILWEFHWYLQIAWSYPLPTSASSSPSSTPLASSCSVPPRCPVSAALLHMDVRSSAGAWAAAAGHTLEEEWRSLSPQPPSLLLFSFLLFCFQLSLPLPVFS